MAGSRGAWLSFENQYPKQSRSNYQAGEFSQEFAFFLNFDIAFCLLKAQHLLALAGKVEQGGPKWLRTLVLVALLWQR